MSDFMPDPTWFGAPLGSLDEARQQWTGAEGLRQRALAAIELCKLGDFSERSAIVEFVHACQDDAERIDAQLALLAVADDALLADPATTSYLAGASFDVLFQFAGNGMEMLARSAVPILLALLSELGELHEIRDYAFSSLDDLLAFDGTGISEDDFTLEQVTAHASTVLGSVDAAYLLHGQPFLPASVAKAMTMWAMRAQQTGTRFSNLADAELLSLWSGVRCPTISAESIAGPQVEELVRYASSLAKLPWQPGVKYFYGHPVEGGASLHGPQV